MTAPLLDKDTLTALLRECVTVVRPGEVLVIRCGFEYTAPQIGEIAEWCRLVHDSIPFRVVVVPGSELGVARSGDRATVTGQWTETGT